MIIVPDDTRNVIVPLYIRPLEPRAATEPETAYLVRCVAHLTDRVENLERMVVPEPRDPEDDPDRFETWLDEYVYWMFDASDQHYETANDPVIEERWVYVAPVVVQQSDILTQQEFIFLATLAGIIVENPRDKATKVRVSYYRHRDDLEHDWQTLTGLTLPEAA